MNLTVAMKIIGGFTIISVLLIATSIISLSNLNTISDSTNQQNELAIPTLKSSNILALELSQLANFSLKGYYETDLAKLATGLNNFKSKDSKFSTELNGLKTIVAKENNLLSNLKQVDSAYASFRASSLAVFENHKNSIEQQNALIEKVDLLEEKADDAVMLLLDLADHDLADTKLQRAISLSEQVENQFNSIVSSAFEYRDTLSISTADLIESELSFSSEEATQSIDEILAELKMNNVSGITEELSNAFAEINSLLSSTNGIVAHKKSQLSANTSAKNKLAESEKNAQQVNDILNKQVNLANQTTIQTSELVESSVSRGTSQTIFISVASIIIAIVIARFTLLSITRPLARVNDMLNVVSSGDLSRKLDESGKDEFAQLSANCNLLIESLRTLIQSIVSRSTQLAAAAEQTSAVTSQSTSAIEEQRNQVEQAASATTEMSSTSQSVLSSANDALGEIKHADDEAERVKVISERNRHTIEELAAEVDSAAQVINQLQQDSASIGSILDVIRGIAEQTNLLALNAAIEAARAGEQGRGFAVVADEVRTLASRTQESTSEIQTMIEALQSGAGKAVTVMDTGKNKASDCVHQSEEADKALETITHAVHEAFDRSSQIATAAEEQSVVAHEISENLESIVAIAEQTTAGSQQTAASSSEVAKLAEELQQSVQEFKL
ncbi:HAMP domain-containing methyl-accepting chemotaxis protein [Litorilituus lipolyticus]|uniref:Methyl-accepting chemotaxis protein n=1 Tax=Litorilituus lipolyticus TaxID=2491017 RepID=A0A502KL44_9GAMM|nr:methyl-accepting chemotaxis protein [Litorilituus lipolyticus]TPH12166.1 methyl-accepting chemotaxis protein [Litorilituus lipolyticus]